VSEVITEIAKERQRQIDDEKWSREHDDRHLGNDLARAAACYAAGSMRLRYADEDSNVWPYLWAWKPKDQRRNLIRAAALIVAEIDRLDRRVQPRRLATADEITTT
jgi:hypothetical protein